MNLEVHYGIAALTAVLSQQLSPMRLTFALQLCEAERWIWNLANGKVGGGHCFVGG